jgi:murein DD-endopeptidase MepM/ murein hydrolase activator NlpD
MRSRRPATVFAAILVIILALALAPAALARGRDARSTMPTVEYRLPFLAGQSYRVTQGWNTTYTHNGHSKYAYDFGLPEGTPVVAAAAGIVAYADDSHQGCGDESLRDAANFVTIDHADGTATLYAHLSDVSVHVGDAVTGGQVIGLSGKAGFTNCEPHLHFARQRQGKAVTQSIPIYFVETGRHQLAQGRLVTSQNPVCSQSSAGMPNEAFCASYTTATAQGPLQVVRLAAAVALTPPATPASAKRGAEPTAAPDVVATWIGRFAFTESGVYTFTMTSSSDVQLSIDGTVAIDSATDQLVAGDHVLQVWMTAGQHVIQVVAGPAPLAYLRLDWLDTGPATTVVLN